MSRFLWFSVYTSLLADGSHSLQKLWCRNDIALQDSLRCFTQHKLLRFIIF